MPTWRFTDEEVVALLPAESADLARELRAVTDGWPAAVRLAIEAFRTLPSDGRRTALARMRRPGGRVYSYLAAEVLEREPPGIQELLRIVASLGRFTPELLRALGPHSPAAAFSSNCIAPRPSGTRPRSC